MLDGYLNTHVGNAFGLFSQDSAGCRYRDNIVILNLQETAFCGTWSMQALEDCVYILIRHSVEDEDMYS